MLIAFLVAWNWLTKAPGAHWLRAALGMAWVELVKAAVRHCSGG